MPKTKAKTMQELLDGVELNVPEIGDVVEGAVVAVTKTGIWLDLGAYGTGLVVGIEISDPSFRSEIKEGSKLSASVVEQEFDNGEVLLSLKKATKEKSWDRLKRLRDEGEIITIKPFEANKGGLMIEVDGVRGFLPVSQLTAENYPRVTDKDDILIKLNQLVKRAMKVGVLDVDRRENKVIFSEKIAKRGEIEKAIEKFKVDDIVKGRVTGLADFGIFLNIEGNIEGLVHISEIAWDKVEDPSSYVKIGDEIEIKIIGIEGDRLSLSIKRLKDDPWAEAVKKIEVGDKLKGEVTRVTPFGAFVKIGEEIEALVHISELSEEHIEDPSKVVKVGKEYIFNVLSIDMDNHRIALSLKEKKAGKDKEKEEKKTKIKKESEKDKKEDKKPAKKEAQKKEDKKESSKKTTKKAKAEKKNEDK